MILNNKDMIIFPITKDRAIKTHTCNAKIRGSTQEEHTRFVVTWVFQCKNECIAVFLVDV